LKIETFDREDHQKKIIAEFEAETLERFKHQAARKIASQSRIPGFRPGKAPYDMVRRIHGDKAILDEAISLLLDDVYPQVIKEAGIESYGPGQLDEVISMDPPKFAFIIPLTPEVVLGDYMSIRLDHTPPVVDESKVEEVIERLRRRTGTAVPVERPAEKGDLVAIKLTGHLLEPAEGEDPILVEENNFEMVAGVPEDHTDNQGNEWPFKGFVNDLVGVSAGENKTVTHTFTDDGSDDDLSGRNAEFTFTVESIKEIHKVELNDEFAGTLGPYDSMETLRKDILKQLQDSESQTYNRNYVEELVGKLLDLASVKFPPVLLAEEAEHTLSHFEEDLARQKMDLETYLKTREMTREELIENEVKPAAEKKVKRQLVLEQFAVKENVQIQANEVQMVYDMALNQAKNDPSMRNTTQKLNTKELADRLARGTINEIFNQRLLNRLRDIATGKADQPVTTEETAELVEETGTTVEEATAPVEDVSVPVEETSTTVDETVVTDAIEAEPVDEDPKSTTTE
jgi:trigger factor